MEMLIYYSYAIHLGIRYSPPGLKSTTWSNPLRGRIVYVSLETGDRRLKTTVAVVYLAADFRPVHTRTPRSRNGAVELQHNAKAQGQGSAVRAAGQFSHMAHPQSTS